MMARMSPLARPARALLAALACALAAGCAVAPPAAGPGPFLADALFAPPAERPDPAAVFAVDEPMRRYLATHIPEAGGKDRQRALVQALRADGSLRLEYDAAMTRNAREAFSARTGNCLSLVIMTAALAREMGIGVHYQSVYVDETWTRRGDLYFSVGHVNLTLGRRPPHLGTRIDDGEPLMVDFLPPPDLKGLNWRTVEEKTILAMYFNNRAAESLAAGEPGQAYWFAREAVLQDPAFVTAYNTLGVVYQRAGHLAQAERVLAWALGREPRNTRVMSNLATVLDALGRSAEARALEARLAQLEPEPPFAFFNAGLEAMKRGEYAKARELFAREIARAPDYHEFHFWMAMALAKLGEGAEARRHLALAMENSTTRKDHDLYAGKLARLRSAGLH